MTAPTLAVGDRIVFTTSDEMTCKLYGVPAPMVAMATITDVYDKPGRWPFGIKLDDGTTLVATENELALDEAAAMPEPVAISDVPEIGATIAREAAA